MKHLRVGSVIIAVVLLRASASWAACPGLAGCTNCERAFCTSEGLWECYPKAAGTLCTNSNLCTIAKQCDGAGTCVGTPVTCTALDQCHDIGTCDATTGACLNPNKPNGTVCNPGNACIAGPICTGGTCGGTPVTCSPDSCHAAGACNPGTGTCSTGALSSPPGVPGAISGPANSTTGSYTLSWGPAGGCIVGWYSLSENGLGIFTAGPQVLSANLGGRSDGTYTYKVQACNAVGCSAFTSNFSVTILLPPGTPGSVTVPAETGPMYTVSWGAASGTIDHYDLGESFNGSAWAITAVAGTFKNFTNKPYGNYTYQVRACNATACSAYVAASLTVAVITGLSALTDSPVILPNSGSIPAQGWVGTLPGAPGVEGGAATYRIPIEVPPGRAGMQPEVALTYSSRNGNGVAGVGWALSAASKVYPCPKTFAQDFANTPGLWGTTLQRNPADRLCFDGKRLVAATPSSYGFSGSEYRTEVDEFARITQSGDMGSQLSSFQIEHKSGRISQYDALSSPGASPEAWYLAREYDRQGNCIAYNYATFTFHGAPDRELSSIRYTGTGTPSSKQCSTGAGDRSVAFVYTSDREDKRTTYRFGSASILAERLGAISTKVGTQYVRTYQLAYKVSGATRRSLLTSATLCAGAVCGNEQLPSTSFTYQEDPAHFSFWHVQRSGAWGATAGFPLGADWRVMAVGDLDGDGTRDRVFAQDTGQRDLELSSGCTQSAFTGAVWLGFDQPWNATSTAGMGALDNGGRINVLGTSGGNLTYSSATCSGSSIVWGPTMTNLSVDGATGAGIVDYDGDGLPDVGYYGSQQTISLHRNTDPKLWAGADSIAIHPPPAPNSLLTQLTTQDVNGDGWVDTIFDDNTVPNNTEPTQIGFLTSMTAGGATTYVNAPLASLGGPGGSFTVNSSRRWIDVNGDGLPDIYDNGTIFMNRGGSVGTTCGTTGGTCPQMFVPVTVTGLPLRGLANAFVMDLDGDGRDELLVPNARVPGYDFCMTIPSPIPGEPNSYCGAEFDTSPGTHYSSYDRSVFTWDAYKFVEANDGSYSVVQIPCNLQAPINIDLLKDDYNGDGTIDVTFRLHKVNGGSYLDLLPADLGPYSAQNSAKAPDLLVTATNGVGATATWAHQPLSDRVATNGCDMPEPFYVSHPDDTRSPGYAFFTSSMWVVARFDTSNGVGTGMNKTCYRYQDAMLNAWGRGIQGFKSIVAEEQMPPAAGEPASSLSGCGGTCSVNNSRTTTQFYQEFPLTSRLNTVTVLNRATGAPLSRTTSWWNVTTGDLKQTVVTPAGSMEQRYDATGPLAVQTTTVSEVDPVSGQVKKACTIVPGKTPDLTGAPKDVIDLDTRTLFNDTTNWWLGRLESHVLLTDFLGATTVAPPTCGVSDSRSGVVIPSWCGSTPTPAAPPSCPTVTASSSTKTRTANYQWYQLAESAYRKVKSEALVIPSNVQGMNESSTAYTYDQFGNALTKQVSARDIGSDATWPPSNRSSTTLPGTTYGYSGDGYFRIWEADPLNHISSQTFDPATGLLLTTQAIQGGPIATNTFDNIGRLITSVTSGGQPVQKRVLACTASNCALKEQALQAGAPIATSYKDLLGRVIASGTEGLDGLEIITKVDFNQRGIRVAEYPPYRSSAAPGAWGGIAASAYPSRYSGLDLLGRPASKTVLRNAPNLFQSGSGDASLTTSYSYAVVSTGIQTTINLPKAAAVGGTLTMFRTYDRQGKLIQTIQRVSVPTSRDILTSYFYDPAGNLTTLRDANGNQITSNYDDLGRKLTVSDPDRGNWTYTWDGLGRLRTQTDARAALLAFQYDFSARLERRFKKETADAQAVLEANWQYDLNNKSGTLGSMVGVLDGFRRDYRYDSLLRPWGISTLVPAGSGWASHQFNVEYGYDYNYGRVKAIAYPGAGDALGGPATGEVVAFNYSDPRGYLSGESANSPGGTPTYRRVTAMSERGQVTAQAFANGVSESALYDDSTGMPLTLLTYGLNEPLPSGCAAQQLLARQVDYKFDQFLNVASQGKQFITRNSSNNALQFYGCTPAGATAVEAYRYDELQRLVGTTRSWSSMTPTLYPNGQTYGDSYSYDDLGNILSKPDYATNYLYGSVARTTGNAGPHAVASVTKGGTAVPFTYDQNGNMLSGDGRGPVTFDYLDRPTAIPMGNVTTQFKYAPDGSRYLQYTSYTSVGPSPYPKAVYYVDKLYERIDWGSAPTEEKSYLGPAVTVYRQGSTRDVRYLHQDRLGSLDSVTSSTGAEVVGDTHGFDAFGMPRARDWQWSGAKLHPDTDYQKTTKRGFTGHEHLDETYLIHMNGRVYDYRLGRFLSVDPIISNPANSQSINPYSYIVNNPLSGVDPTGYAAECTVTTGTHVCNATPAGSNLMINNAPATGSLREFTHNGAERQSATTTAGPVDRTGSTASAGQKAKEDASANEANTTAGEAWSRAALPGESLKDHGPEMADVWLEGPAGKEPKGHLSINIGDPLGKYDSYSFGIDSYTSLAGHVYRDTQLGGDILPGYYLRTTAPEDGMARDMLEKEVGKPGTYGPMNTCRNFCFQQWDRVMSLHIGSLVEAPNRVQFQNQPSFNLWPGLSSTSASDKDNWLRMPFFSTRSTLFSTSSK